MKFCKTYTDKFYNITFTIRLHPILKHKLNYYQYTYSKNSQNKKKIIFSNFQKPSQDFIQNEICLYRGTSLIFDAIKFGLTPFYLMKNNEINFDPVSIIKKNSNMIKDINEFNNFTKNFTNNKKFKFEQPYSLPNLKMIKNFYL